MLPLGNIIERIKKKWMRFALRGVSYSNNYRRLNMIYVVANPWRLDSAREEVRFAETNRLITENIGRVGSLLEVGSGEGYQSFYLRQVCEHLTGMDVSGRAVKRARKRCPDVDFIVGDIFSETAQRKAPFDLVVACEVLYYMKDVAAALQRLQTLGSHCLVTYLAREFNNLDPLVLSMPRVAHGIIEFQDAKWRVAWWPIIER